MGSFIKSLADKYFIAQLEKPKSSIGFKYPTLRDHPLHTPDIWLEGKRADDNAEGLWRIHDNIYDFSDFVKVHPGGSDWLEMTKGTDITEAFEVHHLSSLPENILGDYFVRKSPAPRNSPFTFKEDGFYKTLKRNIRKELENIPEAPAIRSKFIADSLFMGFLISALLATSSESYFMGMLSAAFLTMTCIAAHNFFHQKDNFRMFYFDLTMMSSRGWRISHALSHHIYTNTVYDLEISSLEPFLQHLPIKKNFFIRYISWLYSPIFYSSIYIGYYIKLIIESIKHRKGLRKENYIPWIFALVLYLGSGKPILTVTIFFFWIEFISSLLFGIIGINAAHHHPDLFHDGDAPRAGTCIDWGIHQMDSVMDRSEITGSHFLVLISFGDHALHHLFPTIDHGNLEYLYPVFKKTCKQFGIEFKMVSQLDLVTGQFRQLAKIEPSKHLPESKKM